jgi:hypothetical protein
MKSPHMVMTFHEDYYRIRNLSNQSKLVCKLIICSWFLTMPRGRFQTKATYMQLICSCWFVAMPRGGRFACFAACYLTTPIGKFALFAANYQNNPVTNTELIAIRQGRRGALIHHVNLCFHFSTSQHGYITTNYAYGSILKYPPWEPPVILSTSGRL